MKNLKPIEKPKVNHYQSNNPKAGRLYEKLGWQDFQIVSNSELDITICTTTLAKKLKLTVEPIKQTKTQTIFEQENPN